MYWCITDMYSKTRHWHTLYSCTRHWHTLYSCTWHWHTLYSCTWHWHTLYSCTWHLLQDTSLTRTSRGMPQRCAMCIRHSSWRNVHQTHHFAQHNRYDKLPFFPIYHPCVCMSMRQLSVCLCVCMAECLCVYVSMCLCVCVSMCLCVCVLVCACVSPLLCLCVRYGAGTNTPK